MSELKEFVDYVMMFYGAQEDSVYPEMAFTREEVEVAVAVLLTQYPKFYADSLDRERTRDIVLKTREVDGSLV